MDDMKNSDLTPCFEKKCPRCGAVVTAMHFVCPVCGVALDV